MSKRRKVRVRLKAYDHKILDNSARRIVKASKAAGTQVPGPIPLPTDKEVITILRSVYRHKGSREQFE